MIIVACTLLYSIERKKYLWRDKCLQLWETSFRTRDYSLRIVLWDHGSCKRREVGGTSVVLTGYGQSWLLTVWLTHRLHLFIVALCNRADHIYFHPVVCSSFFLFSSHNLSGRRLDVCHTSTRLSANLGCRSETCCTRLAGNAGRKESPKSRHLRTIAQLCRAISSQLRHVSKIGKKFVKQQYLLH